MAAIHAVETENGSAGEERPYKRQKSDRSVLAENLNNVMALGEDPLPQTPDDAAQPHDETDGILKDFKNGVKKIIHGAFSDTSGENGEINETEDQEEVFENNIRIKNPHANIEDGGIPLGIHLKKATNGFRVHRIIPDGLLHQSPLREDDLIIRVRETELESLEVEDLIQLFWNTNLNIDATVTLTITRKVEDEDEPDSSGERYETHVVHLHVNVDEEEVRIESSVEVASGRGIYGGLLNPCFITYADQGNDVYLCVENEMPSFQPLNDFNDETFHWRLQICHDSTTIPSFLVRNIKTKKFLYCTDAQTGDVRLSMCEGNFGQVGAIVDCDNRWLKERDVDNTTGSFSLQSSKYEDWYLTVSMNQLSVTNKLEKKYFFSRHDV